jgi:predicted MPP superfamily phosphohydrolase
LSPDPDLRQRPRRHPWSRRALVRTLETGARALAGRAWYRRRHLSAGGLAVRREEIAVEGLPPAFERFRVVQLSDLHAGPFVRRGDLAGAVERCNSLGPDVVALTGDFVTHSVDEAPLILDDLALLRAREARLAVLGNHDYRGRREGELVAALEARGIRTLRNASHRIERDGGAVIFVGIEDLEEGRVIDLDAARADVRDGDVEIVLCHNPHGARRIARRGCAAVLSGHTHGGQVDLPLLRRAGPVHPGARIELGTSVLIVSRGLGAIGLPLRVGAPSELVVIELVGAAIESAGDIEAPRRTA